MAWKWLNGAVEHTFNYVAVMLDYSVAEGGKTVTKTAEVAGYIDNINPSGIATVYVEHPITGATVAWVGRWESLRKLPTPPPLTPAQQADALIPTSGEGLRTVTDAVRREPIPAPSQPVPAVPTTTPTPTPVRAVPVSTPVSAASMLP